MGTGAMKVTVILPTETLAQARTITGQGVKATIIAGLEELAKHSHRSALHRLRGKVRIDLDLARTRR